MSTIFTLENITDFSEKLDIDELYEKKRQHDLNQLALFNKVLHRIHVRIKTVSRQRRDEQFCWFVVPEIMLGVPKFDQSNCIAYLMSKLKDNGFNVRYIHPNTLFISWLHWVPSYVRTELKTKTGIIINEFGQKVDSEGKQLVDAKPDNNMLDPQQFLKETQRIKQQPNNESMKKEFTPINTYKPSGHLVYNAELLTKIEDKFS